MSNANLVTFSSLPGASVNVHIAKEVLLIAKKAVIFQQLGEKARMPDGEGKTFQFNRYERLPLPLSPITEGVDPNSTPMTLTTVQAVNDQWGAYIVLTDVAKLTVKHPLMQLAMELLGHQAAELVDREIIKTLLGATSVSYGGTATTRSGLATPSSDSFQDKVAQRVISRLRTRGAHPYEGTNFVGVIDPAMEQDVSQNSNNAFTLAAAYSNVKKLYNGELGMWRGVRWMTSNFIPTHLGMAAVSATSPTSPVGTYATGNYRISVGYYDAQTGFLSKISANSAVAFTSGDSLALTAPADANYKYKVFVGALSGAGADIMYQGLDSTYGSDFIPAGTSVVILDPPAVGLSLAGSNVPGVGINVHFGFVFGKQAFAKVDLQNLQILISRPDASTDNPLLLRRTIGWKLMFKPVIQNNAFMERIEVLSEFE